MRVFSMIFGEDIRKGGRLHLKRTFLAVFACLLCVLSFGAAFGACTPDQIDVTGNGSQCETVKFTLTTTSLAANGSINIWMSAKGTFYIDCGENGTLSGAGTSGKTLTKTTNLVSVVSCEWSSAGVHTIRFGGVATEYASVGLDASSTNAAIQFGASSNQQKIAAVSGSLGALFPQLGTSSNQVPSFASLFDGASNLTSIPSTLFSGLTGSANAKYMFYETFANCTSLTSIPAELFADITTPAGHMFNKTFDGDTNLSGFIPSTTFAGLIANNSPTASNMWSNTFGSTQLLTACPVGSVQFQTRYESNWENKVSCICAGIYFFDDVLNSCTPCPNGYTYNTDNNKTDVSQCQIQCAAGTYVETPGIYGYTVLEYLESSGEAYIDTGFKHNSTNIRGEIRVGSSSNMSHNVNILGNQTATGGYSVGWADNKFKLWVVSVKERLNGPDHPFVANQVYDISYEITANKEYLTDGGITNEKDHPGDILSTNTIHLFDNGIQEMANNFSGRIYWIKLYEDGVLVHNFLPVRRDDDDEIGIFDTVTGQFFVNSGTGTGFTHGGDLSNNCVDSGRGYYAGQSVTNFGDVGERTPCAAGTYSNNLRGTSIATCQQCTGATYSDVEASVACIACPDGYTYDTALGKYSMTQCKIMCPAGTYLPAETIDGGYTKRDYIEATGTQWINTGILASSLVNPIMEYTVQYTKVEKGKQTGAKKNNLDFKVGISNGNLFLCQAGGSNTETKFGAADTAKHTFVLDTGAQTCTLDGETKPLAVGNLTDGPISIGTVNNQSGNAGKQKIYGFRLISNGQTLLDMIPVNDSNGVAGLYDTVNSRFYPSNGIDAFASGPLLNVDGCTDVEPGYWSPETALGYGETNVRHQCPAGTTTVGYGHGADEAADCGKVLNIGTKRIYSKTTKTTTPAINFMTEQGTVYYIGASTTNHTLSSLHLYDGTQQYTAYDDGLLYGERNFSTGERIVQ